jgi:hypothetical protein
MIPRFITLPFLIALLIFTSFASDKGKHTPRKARRVQEEQKITLTPVGPTREVVGSARQRIEASTAFQNELAGKKYRFFWTEYVDNGTASPTEFRAVYYDYTGDRTMVATSDIAGTEPVTFQREYFQPIPTDEELGDARKIIDANPSLGSALQSGATVPFRPMPATTVLEGTTERLVNVGIKSASSGHTEIVSVSMLRGIVIRYASGAPATAISGPDSCGLVNANQPRTPRGTPGSANLTVTSGGTTLWEMTVVRPSVSSGTNASAIELQNVKYKGKSVLKRMHTPILDVQYDTNACGPYRDWEFDEGMFQTPDTGNIDVVDGIRQLAPGQVATTALESGNDTGNFRGVAIYTQNNETVLVTEMEAGWYRYIAEYRFATDGTIRPRFGFGGVQDNCICVIHHHHVYWRFDFDVVSPTNRVYQSERGRKFLQPITTETNRDKNIATNRRIVVQNSNGNEAYVLIPNVFDGTVSPFAVNDFWILRYKNVPGGTPVQNEIDDGVNPFIVNPSVNINITPFVNGESLVDQDVVVWYGAHFDHIDGANAINSQRSPKVLTGDHVVGPDLRPIRW